VCVLKKSHKKENEESDDDAKSFKGKIAERFSHLPPLLSFSSTVLHAMDDDPEKNQSNKIIKL